MIWMHQYRKQIRFSGENKNISLHINALFYKSKRPAGHLAAMGMDIEGEIHMSNPNVSHIS